MADASTLIGLRSLAEYLCGLAEGDRCPCCGEALRADSSARESEILRCSTCGCEVEAEEWPFRTVADRAFERAA
jgi:hypothetical protein